MSSDLYLNQSIKYILNFEILLIDPANPSDINLIFWLTKKIIDSKA